MNILLFILYILPLSCISELSYPVIFGSYKEIAPIHQSLRRLRLERGGKFTSKQDLDDVVISWLSTCPADTYLFVDQPGVTVDDFQSYISHSGALDLWTELKKLLGRVGTIGSFPRIDEPIDYDIYIDLLKNKCGCEIMDVIPGQELFEQYGDIRPRIIKVKFPKLNDNIHEREKELAANDKFLLDIMGKTPSPFYAVVYTSSTGEPFGTGREWRAKRYLDIFPELVRQKRDPQDRQEYKRNEPRKPQKSGTNEPIRRIPPQAEVNKQAAKRQTIKQHKMKQIGKQGTIIKFMDDLLTIERVQVLFVTNIIALMIYMSMRFVWRRLMRESRTGNSIK